jgi:hypothetical protein
VGRGGVEAQDARIFSPVLYQLSYLPKRAWFKKELKFLVVGAGLNRRTP